MDAKVVSRFLTEKKNNLLNVKELDACIKYSSSVRFVCPKTGAYLTEAPELPQGINLRHRILNYKGGDVFLSSIRRQCRRKGFNKLTDSQKEAAARTFDRMNRGDITSMMTNNTTNYATGAKQDE